MRGLTVILRPGFSSKYVMADFTQTRYSALVQLLLATLLVIFGIVDRVIVHSASSTVSFGIWVGLWVGKLTGLALIEVLINRAQLMSICIPHVQSID